jgi:hypothetical protein
MKRTSTVGSNTLGKPCREGDACRHRIHARVLIEHAEGLTLALTRSGFGSHRPGIALEIQPNRGKTTERERVWTVAGSDWWETEHHSFRRLTYRAGRLGP